MTKAPITTHILNLGSGTPISHINVALFGPEDSNTAIAQASTDSDGRIAVWDKPFELTSGVWQLVFATEEWFKLQGQACFFADVRLAFHVEASQPHYHVPLLLNNYGYSTYRGS